METVNAPKPVHRSLAVIDGGLNCTTDTPTPPTAAKPRLLDQVRQAIRTRHYSPKTEEAYIGWIKRFIFFHGKRHPAEMGEAEIARFLSGLARDSRVSASTQNQALNALLFLYHHVLRKEIGYVNGIVRAKKPRRLPVVLTKQEVKRVLSCLSGTPWLMAILLYGAGLRLLECCRLRVKDIDFSRNQITVRAGKGDKDRYTMLPAAVKEPLLRHLQAVKLQHEKDIQRGLGSVALPNALEPNTRMREGSGPGNGCSPLPAITSTGRPEKDEDTIFTSRFCSGPLERPGLRRGFLSPQRVIAFAILLRPTYWKMAMTLGRFKSCWGIPMSPRLWCTPTY